MSEQGRRTQNGFTVLEMAVVLAILAPVLGIAFSGMTSVMTTSAVAATEVGAQRQIIFTTKRLRDDFRKCQVTAVAPTGLSITYQHPVDPAGTGLAIDAMGGIVWGAKEAAGPVAGASYTVSFVQDGLVQEMVLQTDLNGDGDMVDSYQVGHLQRTTTGGTLVDVSPSVFLVDAFTPTGDLNGDGQPDPLFAWTPGGPVDVKLLARTQQPDGEVTTRFTELRVYLPNMN